MYTSYSTLQRKQLSKQVYTDTQSTYLLVYAPGRHKALQAALQNQLHRKFRLVTQLDVYRFERLCLVEHLFYFHLVRLDVRRIFYITLNCVGIIFI